MRILLVEDDLKIASFIAKGLKEAGFAVDIAADGKEGLHFGLTEPYDVCIIDIMLPVMDGLAVIEQMRHQGVSTPVLILSARRSVDDRVKGLQTGGDDYLVKPFAFSELLARLHALIRRSSTSVSLAVLTANDLQVNVFTHEVIRGGQRVDLQPKEFALLHYLMRNEGRVVSKTMIMEHVWDYHFDPQTNVVDVLVCRLRSKIDRDCDRQLIHTIRGVGYVLKPDK